jgi:hypothetical protein
MPNGATGQAHQKFIAATALGVPTRPLKVVPWNGENLSELVGREGEWYLEFDRAFGATWWIDKIVFSWWEVKEDWKGVKLLCRGGGVKVLDEAASFMAEVQEAEVEVREAQAEVQEARGRLAREAGMQRRNSGMVHAMRLELLHWGGSERRPETS